MIIIINIILVIVAFGLQIQFLCNLESCKLICKDDKNDINIINDF